MEDARRRGRSRARRVVGPCRGPSLSVRTLADPRSAILRTTIALVLGSGAAAMAFGQSFAFPLLFGWNTAGLVLLLLSWTLIWTADGNMTQKRAGADDPGRTFVYFIVLLASVISLLSALQLGHQFSSMPPARATMAEIQCLLTVALAWGLTHTSFTLRYAHLYYREDDQGVGGVEFPGGGTPSYLDFAYFAFTIGMCFQTSDCSVTSSQIRRAVLFHAIISFAYNTAIIAFVLNLVFGKVS